MQTRKIWEALTLFSSVGLQDITCVGEIAATGFLLAQSSFRLIRSSHSWAKALFNALALTF